MSKPAKVAMQPGAAYLFNDARLRWAEQVFGGFSGLDVLEPGPLEGAHSYMLQQIDARRITAIEGNKRAFLKCLCLKELLGLDRVSFKLGNFVEFLREELRRYDAIFASGGSIT